MAKGPTKTLTHFVSSSLTELYLDAALDMAVDTLRNGVLPGLNDILHDPIRHDVEDDQLHAWDKGVFLNELLRQKIVLSKNDEGALDGGLVANKGLVQGTYHGTRLALTEIYSMIEEAYVDSIFVTIVPADSTVPYPTSTRRDSNRSFPSPEP